jgi:hypothetical protein
VIGNNQDLIDMLARRIDAERAQANGHKTAPTTSKPSPPSSPRSDEDVLRTLFGEKGKGSQWEDTYNGAYEAYYPSPSEAVGALLWKLAFHTGKDPAQMDRLIRGSALAGPKFDERRGSTTWLAREIAKAIENTDEVYDWDRSERPRSFSSSSDTPGGGGDDENKNEPEIVRFHELGKPKPRRFIVEKIGRKAYPLIVYGAGGVAKSFAVLAGGIALASTEDALGEWIGLRVLEHGEVLYIDFELDVDEQHTRVVELCKGLGVPVPERLAYLSGRGFARDAVFAMARKFCKDHEAIAVIIDSVGQAMTGDMDKNRDVNAFYRDHVEPFCAMGVTPMLVDHQGKIQSGEKHKDKSPIGGSTRRTTLGACSSSYWTNTTNRPRPSTSGYARIRPTTRP